MNETTSNYTESTEITTAPLSDENRVAEITTEILQQKNQVCCSFIQIGRLLDEARGHLKKEGQWLKWLETSVSISARMAQRYIQLAEAFPDATSVTHLGITKALALLALRETQREEFIREPHEINGTQKTIDNMSVRELRHVIRKNTEPAKPDNMSAKKADKVVDTTKQGSLIFKPVRNPRNLDNSKTLIGPDGFGKLTADIESAQTNLDDILKVLEAQETDLVALGKIAEDLRSLSEKVQKCLSLAQGN